MSKWHSKSLKETFAELKASEDGLSDEEANKRLKHHGKNKIKREKKVSPLRIFVAQFTDFLILILLVAAGVCFWIGITVDPGKLIDATLILSIVILNGIFGFIQDWKAERSIEALRKLAAPKANVLREGHRKKIEAEQVVPGDILLLEEGDSVAADSRIIHSTSLQANESNLTGESFPVRKERGKLRTETPLADRKNMVYSSTNVTWGHGRALVVETGMSTEVGKIAEKLERIEEEATPFQKEMNRLGKKLGIGTLGICGFIGAILIIGQIAGIFQAFLTSISLAIAAVPEGLPAVVTLSLALGTRRLLRKNSLIRRLPVVEGLGSTTCICADKTGTLTEERMTVKELWINGKSIKVTGTGYQEEGKFLLDGEEIKPTKGIKKLLQCGSLCNNASIVKEEGKKSYHGDPTELALLISARKAGFRKERLEHELKRVHEIPFSSEEKRMTIVNEKDGKQTVFMKGAPEVVLERCNRILLDDKIEELSSAQKESLLKENERMATSALRVLGFAYKPLGKNWEEATLEQDLIFIGLQGMMDPPRPKVKEALDRCRQGGIRIIMITGDHALTAKAVAKELKWESLKTLEGKELEKISDEELAESLKKVSIFARVNPSHKVRIEKALRKRGEIIGMTGDGVNDAPAIKAADTGIAMGIRGTDVAKQASDMVLLDDNFVSIQKAIKHGRGAFDNIRKFVKFLLGNNLAEVCIIFICSLLFKLCPLTPVQILWINLVTDGPPALALGNDPPNPGIMRRKPRPKEEGVVNKPLIYFIGGIGSIYTAILLLVYFAGLSWIPHHSVEVAGTMVFTAFILYELLLVGIMKSEEKIGWLDNKWLLPAVAASFAISLIIIYSPVNTYFELVPIGIAPWAVVGAGAVVGFGLGILLIKAIIRTQK